MVEDRTEEEEEKKEENNGGWRSWKMRDKKEVRNKKEKEGE